MTTISLYNDKGYVTLVDHLGSDLSFVNAARASYKKQSTEWNDKEERLLRFLIREKHMSVFRHAAVTFQVSAPLFVARQHFKYQVASAHIDDQNGWNEMSKRYVTSNNEFHIPHKDQWREAPANSKQGSGEQLDPRIGEYMTKGLIEYVDKGEAMYNEALQMGVCAEQARLFLPAYALMINYQWTVSFANLLHFFEERIEHTAQKEIQELAEAILTLTESLFPSTIKIIKENNEQC